MSSAVKKPMVADVPGEQARDRYEQAEARRVQIHNEWHDEGRPVTAVLANGVMTIHPLLKALESAEAHATKMMAALRPGRNLGGRPTGAASAPDRTVRRGQLRSVENPEI